MSRGARAELEKSMNVQDLLDSAELNSTEAIHSSMAQISAAPTPVEALGPLGELTSHLNTYRVEWSKAQAPIELEALRGAFAHLSSKLQEAEASRQSTPPAQPTELSLAEIARRIEPLRHREFARQTEQ